jgi:uncharacterized protein (TIGR00251 family)
VSGFYRWEGDRLLLSVRVQPRASRDEIVGPHGDKELKVRITAPPVDGKANAHLIRFLAKAFGVPRSRVTLVGGESSRSKHLAIDSPTTLPALSGITPATPQGKK